MVRFHNKEGYALVKTWLVQTPPVFETANQLRGLFDHIGEDTALATSLFPDILQLIPVEGYKSPILQLMANWPIAAGCRLRLTKDILPGYSRTRRSC